MADKFTLEVDGSVVSFTEKELFAFLLEKIHSSYLERADCKNAENYVQEIFMLISSEILSTANFNQLFTLFFLSGFYYANFIFKNEVQITEEQEKE